MAYKFYIKMDEEAMLKAPGKSYDMALVNTRYSQEAVFTEIPK